MRLKLSWRVCLGLLLLMVHPPTFACEENLSTRVGSAAESARELIDAARAEASADLSAVDQSFISEAHASLEEHGLGASAVTILPWSKKKRGRLRAGLGRLRALFKRRRRRDASAEGTARGGLSAAAALGVRATLRAFARTSDRLRSRGAEVLGGSLVMIDLHLSQRAGGGAGLPAGWREVVAAQGIGRAATTIFFYLTLVHGVRRWEALAIEDGGCADGAARAASAFVPLVVGLTGPVISWATTTNVLTDLGPLTVNSGHLTLAGLAAAAGLVAFKPTLLNLVHAPATGVARAWSALQPRAAAVLQ